MQIICVLNEDDEILIGMVDGVIFFLNNKDKNRKKDKKLWAYF